MNGMSRVVVERYLTEVVNGANPASARELLAHEMLGERVVSFQAAFPRTSR